MAALSGSIQVYSKTAAEFITLNPVLLLGQIAFESDTNKIKVGDGVSHYNDLSYIGNMVYPSAGIPLSTGSGWGSSIPDNHANWDTAYSWGNHAGLYDTVGTAAGLMSAHTSAFDHSLIATSYQIGGNTLAATGYIGSLNSFPVQIGANSLVHLEFQTTNAIKYLSGQYWYPSTDSTTAFQLRRADGSTVDFNYDSTNGRIGLGTASPSSKLHVVQSIDGGGGIDLYGYGTGADGYMQMYIETNNNGKYLTINSRYGTIYRINSILLAQFLSGVMNVYGSASQPSNRIGFSQQFSLGYNWTDSKLYLANYNQSTKYMSLDTSGNFGIGITSPASKLHIDFGNATAGSLQFTNGTTTGTTSSDGFHVGLDTNGNAIINQKENLYLALYTNNTERLRYFAGGGTSERTGTYKYLDASPTADTVDDIRISNQSGTFTVEKCTVANATKGAGTWETILTA